VKKYFKKPLKVKLKLLRLNQIMKKGTAFIRNDREMTGEVLEEVSGVSDDIFEEVGEQVPEAIRKTKADGGRMGYAGGGMGKRAFLKIIGGVGAGIAGLKTGLLGLTKGGGKKVATEVAKEATTGGAPPHFLKLVAKIKALGDESTAKYANQRQRSSYKIQRLYID
jgi:hypothetical protein